MKWLLDTNVVSESSKQRPARSVIEWLRARSIEDLAISIVTFAELLEGAQSSRDETQRQKLTGWVESEVSSIFRERTLPLDIDVLTDWLLLSRQLRNRGQSRDASDLLIAATARVYALTLVTRNIRHFSNTGIVIYDPWSGKSHVMEAPDAR